MEDARSKIAQLGGADQLDHKEKVKEFKDKTTSLAKEVKGLKTRITNTSGDFKTIKAAVNLALRAPTPIRLGYCSPVYISESDGYSAPAYSTPVGRWSSGAIQCAGSRTCS